MKIPEARKLILGAACLLLLIYILFQARFLIMGPRVNIVSPQDGSSVSGQVVTVEGTASNVAWLTLNGRQIYTDESGHWTEKLLVAPGLSIMTVTARDRFGREIEKSIQIVLNQ
jgi:hypothetical protein